MAANTIYFGTNRQIVREKPARLGNSYNADRPYYFRVGEVSVAKVGDSWKDPDKAYKCGKPVLYREKPGRANPANEVLGSSKLFESLHATMRNDPRDVLIFLHGFASPFEGAMERAAELRDQYLSPRTDPDTGILGKRGREPLVFAFSWPSDGKVASFVTDPTEQDEREWSYSSDREDARASGMAIARCALRMFEFLNQMSRDQQCSQRIHLVAHSMGNWALRHAVQELKVLAEGAGMPLTRIFDNTFLMAADINDDALEKEDWLAPLLRLSRKVHVYHATNDSALSLSDVKPNQGARMGHYGPANMAVLSDRVTAIDCSDVSFTPSLSHVRHQYYRIAPEVVRDVRGVLADKAPDDIAGRRALGGGRYRVLLDNKVRKKLRGW